LVLFGFDIKHLDPAYPSSRQIVYLSVAQPRGLIILRKAGELHQDVREYVENELSVVLEVPSLHMESDGQISGDINGKLLNEDMEKKDLDPGIILGPDSIGTLSFTSGSTGIPKGVRGRHFSLTHFYPWMAEEFELSKNERFTMLSGIAHEMLIK
jgi:L-aminoadipate-semialdehyde dehydrogenase